jgi:hypothetical protein
MTDDTPLEEFQEALSVLDGCYRVRVDELRRAFEDGKKRAWREFKAERGRLLAELKRRREVVILAGSAKPMDDNPGFDSEELGGEEL